MKDIKRIKYLRLKPVERFLIDLLLNSKEYISEIYPDEKYYKIDDELLFVYDSSNNYFYCNYDKIWLVFYKKFNLNYIQIIDLIKYMVEKHLKINNIIPSYSITKSKFRWKNITLITS